MDIIIIGGKLSSWKHMGHFQYFSIRRAFQQKGQIFLHRIGFLQSLDLYLHFSRFPKFLVYIVHKKKNGQRIGRTKGFFRFHRQLALKNLEGNVNIFAVVLESVSQEWAHQA